MGLPHPRMNVIRRTVELPFMLKISDGAGGIGETSTALIVLHDDRATLFDREKMMRMLAVNRDIMIRTAALITAFLFFTAQGARAGDIPLAANSVLNNFLLISAFFLDGLANAAEQLCGRAFGARDESVAAANIGHFDPLCGCCLANVADADGGAVQAKLYGIPWLVE